ncbi:Aldolase [Mycena venus]|uniref:Aldolase n=1 Tax=Mycena venus TaxID=2733690 RepID=A0A8H6X7D6_9AGAR|nr:Aldolase [Mycena venus]
MSSTLLTQIRGLLTVDVDSMDPDVAARHSMPQKFCDMTSNQAIVHGQAALPARRDLLKAAVEYVGKKTPQESGTFEQEVVDVLTVLLAKEVYPHLTGNVHAQTSPSAAYDTEKTIKHASKLVALFADHGISQDRVCIKIPATPESLLACRELQAGGIQTLATCLFSLPQAVAASQAGCTYVAPYFNELRVHFEPGVWVEKFESKTLVMPASIVTPKEVIALVSLSPDHLTLSGSILDALATLPALAPESFTSPDPPPDLRFDGQYLGDYLAYEGALLRETLAEPEVQRKLADALAIFGQKEQETRQLVKAFVAGNVHLEEMEI